MRLMSCAVNPQCNREKEAAFCKAEHTKSCLVIGGGPAGCPTAQQAAESLYERTHNIVIITLGSRGCLLLQEGKCTHIPTEAVQIQDTIGAAESRFL